MKAKWEPKIVEVGFQEVSDEDYEQRLEELARIVYEWNCQLRKANQLKHHPVESQARSVPVPSNQSFRRSGTHG